MRSSVISLALAAIIGVVIGLLLQSPDSAQTVITNTPQQVNPVENDADSTDNKNAASDLDAIRQQLSQEVAARKQLQNEVSQLSKKLAQIASGNPVEENTDSPHSATADTAASTGSRAWFNQQALIDAGVDAAIAEDLKNRYEKQELEKLYLRDQATREGWLGSQRYRDELSKLDNQLSGLQDELGEDSYAAYLYATGQSNRVTVQSVLANSAADTAGIQTNDQVLRYGDQRIYNWRDLRQATTQGDINDTVSVEVIRDGKRMQLYVKRGPLGIRMSSVSVAP